MERPTLKWILYKLPQDTIILGVTHLPFFTFNYTRTWYREENGDIVINLEIVKVKGITSND